MAQHDKHIILGVHIRDRIKEAVHVQDLFTQYGCNIKTRIGLHEADGAVCVPGGVILLEMVGEEDKAMDLMAQLNAIEDVEVKEMVFAHE